MKYFYVVFTILFGLSISHPTYAQNTIEAFGFELSINNYWDIDTDAIKNCIFLNDNRVGFSEAATLLIYVVPSDSLRNEANIKKYVRKFFLGSLGTYYQQTRQHAEKNTSQRNLQNNGIDFQEFSTTTKPDETGEYEWGKIWIAQHQENREHVFFVGASWVNPQNSKLDQREELDAMLRSINKPIKAVKYGDRILKVGESIDFTVLFEADKAEIDRKSRAEIKDIIAFLKDNPKVFASVVGYANKVQGENRTELARERAEKIKQALIKGGIQAERLVSVGSEEIGIDKRVKIIIDKIY